MPADPETLTREYERLKAERTPWESTWDALAQTCLPAGAGIGTTGRAGQKQTSELFDNTGLDSAAMLASHLMGSVTNFQTQWFSLRMRQKGLNDQREVGVWLDTVGDIMHDAMASSNVPQAIHELYRMYALMGTGCLFVDERPIGPEGWGFSGLLTRSLPIATYVLAEDATGQVDTVYRELELAPRQALQQFGHDALAPEMRQQLEQTETRHKPMPFLHAVYPRQERSPGRDDQARMPWASVYLDVAHQHLCSEGGYRWFPYMVPRWEKIRAWSPYGFGPGHLALPEILTLNAMDKDVLRALRLYILPPYWTDDPDAVGRVSFLPGSVNPIGKGSRIESMRPGGDLNLARLGIEERRQRVRMAFYVDQLRALPSPDAPGQMTAYEVAQRLALMQRLMGPAFMRLLGEFLNPFMDVVFGLLLEARELPDPPDVVIEAALANQGRLDVEYQGPLARAQRGEEADAILQTLALAERLATAKQDPSIFDNFDVDEMLRRAAKVYGVPAAILRDPAQVQAQRQARAEAQQAQRQAAELMAGAQAAGQAAPALKALLPAAGQEVAA